MILVQCPGEKSRYKLVKQEQQRRQQQHQWCWSTPLSTHHTIIIHYAHFPLPVNVAVAVTLAMYAHILFYRTFLLFFANPIFIFAIHPPTTRSIIIRSFVFSKYDTKHGWCVRARKCPNVETNNNNDPSYTNYLIITISVMIFHTQLHTYSILIYAAPTVAATATRHSNSIFTMNIFTSTRSML